MTSKERADLAKVCEETDFKLPNKDKNNKTEPRVTPNFACVHILTSRIGGGHHGLPILARSGDKSKPRYAILQPPTNMVIKVHDGSDYIYANQVALFVKNCWINNVSLKVRYEDTPGTPDMLHPNNIRLYQDPYTQIPDQPIVGGKNGELDTSMTHSMLAN